MAQVTTVKVVEGDSHLVVRLDFSGDGSGELTNEVVLSPSDCVPARSNNKPAFRLMQAWLGLVWFDVVMGYGTLQPETVFAFARDSGNHVDFRSFGGLRDYTSVPPADDNGKLWVSTNGLVNGSKGTLVLELRKLNP